MEENDDVDVRNCPFCGGRVLFDSFATNEWIVLCERHCFSMPATKNMYFTSIENAIKAANQRYCDNDMR